MEKTHVFPYIVLPNALLSPRLKKHMSLACGGVFITQRDRRLLYCKPLHDNDDNDGSAQH